MRYARFKFCSQKKLWKYITLCFTQKLLFVAHKASSNLIFSDIWILLNHLIKSVISYNYPHNYLIHVQRELNLSVMSYISNKLRSLSNQFPIGVTLWDLCHLAMESETPFDSINYKRHLAICIVITQKTQMISICYITIPKATIALCQFHVS